MTKADSAARNYRFLRDMKDIADRNYQRFRDNSKKEREE